MPTFRIPVQIVPRQGILDPQGTAVAGALRALGFTAVTDVRVGRFIVVDVDAADESAARDAVREMCARLLANPVTEDFVIESASTVTQDSVV